VCNMLSGVMAKGQTSTVKHSATFKNFSFSLVLPGLMQPRGPRVISLTERTPRSSMRKNLRLKVKQYVQKEKQLSRYPTRFPSLSSMSSIGQLQGKRRGSLGSRPTLCNWVTQKQLGAKQKLNAFVWRRSCPDFLLEIWVV